MTAVLTPSPTMAAAREDVPVAAPAVSRTRALVAAALLGLGALFLLLLVVPGTLDGSDAQSMYQVMRSIVDHGDVTVASGAPIGVPGLYGHYYSKYGPAQSLAAIPLFVIGRALGALVPPYIAPELPTMASSLLPAVVTALTVELLFLTALELGATARGALALSAVYLLATPAIVYAVQWFSEPLTACALLAAVYALLRDRRAPSPWCPLAAGAALAVAVCTRLDALLFVPPLFVYLLVPARDRGTRGDGADGADGADGGDRGAWRGRALSFLLPLGLALAGLASYNADRFGSPFESGYGIASRPDVDYFAWRDANPPHTVASLAQGLYGLLLSPGKGLIEYAPPLLLAPAGAALLWARRRAETLLLLSLFVICLVAHANVLIRWLGGWSWGPRFLVPVLPLALLLLAPLLGPGVHRPRRARVRVALAALAAIGLAVQVPALIVHEPHAYINAIRLPYFRRYCRPYTPPGPGRAEGCRHPVTTWTRIEDDYSFVPADSPIPGAWRVLGRPDTWAQPPDVSPAAVASKNITTAPRAWWWLLHLQGVPAAALWAACAALLALALACGGGAAFVLSPRPGPPRRAPSAPPLDRTALDIRV